MVTRNSLDKLLSPPYGVAIKAKRSGKGRNTRKTRKNWDSKITDRSVGNGQMSLSEVNTNDQNSTERLHIIS